MSEAAGARPGITRPLGRPIPDSPHAVSVSMPTWADVIGYEEGDPAVHKALACGYPRFVFHPRVRSLFQDAETRLAQPGEKALVLTSLAAAERCLALVTGLGGTGRLAPYGTLVAVLVPEKDQPLAKLYWQHTGEIVSSRRADAVLAGRPDLAEAPAVKAALQQRLAGLAGLAGVPDEAVSLFPTGMAALHLALRLIGALHPGRPTAQFGFPYLDSLKLQQKLGVGALFLPMTDEPDWQQLEAALTDGTLGGVFCELPSNPLMRSVDLPRLAQATRAAGVPLVIDDSVATFYNHDFRPYADILVSSLTKFFSGTGEAMGGALILNPASPLHDRLVAARTEAYEDLFFGEDAAVILQGSGDFEARMAVINGNAEALAAALAAHPAVAKVHYPSIETPDLYRQAMRAHGGCGGMLSVVLHGGEAQAIAFFDRLPIDKGPSFGLSTTLACPYTQLAHFTELDWAEACGVSRHLIRVSVGLEDRADLIDRFLTALDGLAG
jgi:cystathionine gamma-synthase